MRLPPLWCRGTLVPCHCSPFLSLDAVWNYAHLRFCAGMPASPLFTAAATSALPFTFSFCTPPRTTDRLEQAFRAHTCLLDHAVIICVWASLCWSARAVCTALRSYAPLARASHTRTPALPAPPTTALHLPSHAPLPRVGLTTCALRRSFRCEHLASLANTYAAVAFPHERAPRTCVALRARGGTRICFAASALVPLDGTDGPSCVTRLTCIYNRVLFTHSLFSD